METVIHSKCGSDSLFAPHVPNISLQHLRVVAAVLDKVIRSVASDAEVAVPPRVFLPFATEQEPGLLFRNLR